jgi:putative transcriptional regulator
MAISYKPLWKLLITKGLKKQDLQKKVGLSSTTIAKLGKSAVVRTDILDRICVSLNCDINDIMEIEKHEKGEKHDE